MGEKKSSDESASSLVASIIATIRSSKNGKSMDLAELRTAVLTPGGASDAIDKSSKKLFKQAVKLLEKEEKVSLNADGFVKLSKAQRAKSKRPAEGEEQPKSDKKKKRKKEKKRRRESTEFPEEEDGGGDDDGDRAKKTKQTSIEESKGGDEEPDTTNNCDNDIDPKEKNKPCKGNPQGITRLFLGNLPFAITEPTLNDHLNNCITHIKVNGMFGPNIRPRTRSRTWTHV